MTSKPTKLVEKFDIRSIPKKPPAPSIRRRLPKLFRIASSRRQLDLRWMFGAPQGRLRVLVV